MIIPLTHENMKGRRWPYVTMAIIALNLLVFLGTHWKIEEESQQIAQLEVHILVLDAAHPDIQVPPAAQKMVDAFSHENAQLWHRLRDGEQGPVDAWDIQMRDWTPEQASAEMANLSQQLEQAQHDSILQRFAYYSYRPTPQSFLTANFLHGGWMHLIFNMWFLWLAGTILEDVWGRVAFPIFYLVGGVVALLVQGAIYPNSIIPVLGASGAIAALIGAFLVRFPKTKIQLGMLWWVRFYKFSTPAYILLPLWLVIQLFWGMLTGAGGGVAYWAHIGGFAFGVVGALALRYTGIESKLDQAIEAQVSWSADPRVVHASELLAQNQADPAIVELRQVVQEKPDLLEAHDLLLKAYWRKQDVPAQLQTLATLCALHVKARELDLAWQSYEEFVRAGGEKLPGATWLELCRYLESQQSWESAAAEYEKLA
jgi:membrane associated rhomboid family serine protease